VLGIVTEAGGQTEQQSAQQELAASSGLPAMTVDGFRVEMAANIGGLWEAGAALAAGAESVGVLRTEFLFLNRETLPSEREQFEAYREVLSQMAPRRVVVRTLDIGGDKAEISSELEAAPLLGAMVETPPGRPVHRDRQQVPLCHPSGEGRTGSGRSERAGLDAAGSHAGQSIHFFISSVLRPSRSFAPLRETLAPPGPGWRAAIPRWSRGSRDDATAEPVRPAARARSAAR